MKIVKISTRNSFNVYILPISPLTQFMTKFPC
uniref:Uncharacterized protein n=1 Tax=Tetranychus urticae TaxID=32264 RepID=T1KRI6_TETUR